MFSGTSWQSFSRQKEFMSEICRSALRYSLNAWYCNTNTVQYHYCNALIHKVWSIFCLLSPRLFKLYSNYNSTFWCRLTCGRWRVAQRTSLQVLWTRMTLCLETSRTSTSSTTGTGAVKYNSTHEIRHCDMGIYHISPNLSLYYRCVIPVLIFTIYFHPIKSLNPCC